MSLKCVLTSWLNKEEKRHGPTGRLSGDPVSIWRVAGGSGHLDSLSCRKEER